MYFFFEHSARIEMASSGYKAEIITVILRVHLHILIVTLLIPICFHMLCFIDRSKHVTMIFENTWRLPAATRRDYLARVAY